MRVIKIFFLLMACSIDPPEDIKEKEIPTPVEYILEDSSTPTFQFPTARTPNRKGKWSTPPDIIICKELMFNRERVFESVKFWESLGHVFGEIYDIRCDFLEMKAGAIFLVNPGAGYDFKHLSNTITTYAVFKDGHREIVAAQINMTFNAKSTKRILEHEIGHALGYQHISRRGHIMHPRIEMGGNGSDGLRVNSDI